MRAKKYGTRAAYVPSAFRPPTFSLLPSKRIRFRGRASLGLRRLRDLVDDRSVMHTLLRLLVPLLAALACGSCQALKHEAWSQTGKGTHTVGVSSGWAFYEADVDLTDVGNDSDDAFGDAPDLGSGSDTSNLQPIFGTALKYSYFVHDNVALGGLVEYRVFDAGKVAPLESEIEPDEYSTWHFLLTSRFFTNPFGHEDRLRLFGGLDLGYIPKVDLDATVTYAPGLSERLQLQGDEYFTLGAVAGGSMLVTDNISLEFGAFYEWAIDSSDDTLILNVPNTAGGTTPNTIEGEVSPFGLIFFAGATLYL